MHRGTKTGTGYVCFAGIGKKREERGISVRVAVSYAGGSRQVVEWNRYLPGKIITVLFPLSRSLPRSYGLL